MRDFSRFIQPNASTPHQIPQPADLSSASSLPYHKPDTIPIHNVPTVHVIVNTDTFDPSYIPPEDSSTNRHFVWRRSPVLMRVVALFMILLTVIAQQIISRLYLSDFIDDSYGSNIFEFIEATRDLSYEVHGEFDFLGNTLYTATQYDPQQVQLSTEISQIASRASFGHSIAVHNHPSDVPFSIPDLLSSIGATDFCRRQIVISPSYVYELSAPNGWPQLELAYGYIISKTMFLEDAAAAGFIEFELEGDTVEIYSTNLLLESYAEEFDLVYTVTPINEWSLY